MNVSNLLLSSGLLFSGCALPTFILFYSGLTSAVRESRAEDVKKILELEPNNREARALAKNAQAGQKEEDKKSKGLFGKMCKAGFSSFYFFFSGRG